MLMQFNSIRPMIGGDYLRVFARDFRDIPDWVREPYAVQGAAVDEFTNIDEIIADVDAKGFTYGIEVPVTLSAKRLAFTYLNNMEAQG